MIINVPFTQINVFGEPPVITEPVKKLIEPLNPSRGILGAFGDRTSKHEDRPHVLYLAEFKKNPDLILGRSLHRNEVVVKIGITGDIAKRFKALNLSFPETASIGWTLARTANFPDRAAAASAEQSFKDTLIAQNIGTSLGREFFVTDQDKTDSLFSRLSQPTGLSIRA